jgi:hypothetical protein
MNPLHKRLIISYCQKGPQGFEMKKLLFEYGLRVGETNCERGERDGSKATKKNS